MCGGREKTRTEREEGRKGKGDLCSPPDRMVREAKSRSSLVGITVCPPACPSLPEASPASLRRSLPRSSARRRSVSFLLRKGNTRWIGEILIMSPAIHPSIHSSGRARPSARQSVLLRIWLLRPLRCGRAWNKRLNCFCRICYRSSRRFSFNHLFAQVRTGFFCFGEWRGTQREIKYRLNLGGEVTSEGGREQGEVSAVSRSLCPCACRGFLFRLHSCTLPLHKRILSAVSASGEERKGGRPAQTVLSARRMQRKHATAPS